jgi:hypothetical protein
MVEFPHCPFGETMRVPEGRGGATEELGGTTGVDEDDGIGVGVGVGVELGGGGGGASPQRPYWGWHPTISPQNSNSVPQYPYKEQH